MHTTLRHSWRASLAILAILTAITVLPSSASAAKVLCPLKTETTACQWVDDPIAPLSHIGWTYLNNNYCPPGMACIQGGPDGYLDSPAWRWSGTAWSQTTLSQGWVYVYPYTGQWRWAWTQRTGWVAISGGRFDIRLY